MVELDFGAAAQGLMQKGYKMFISRHWLL